MANDALELLMQLLKEGEFQNGDSMACALAFVNSYLYSIADVDARRLIREDILKHHRLYRKVAAYQRQVRPGPGLSDAPVVPKIYWADRHRTMELESGVLTAKYYAEFIDRIEVLEAVHQLVVDNRLGEGPTAGLETLTRKGIAGSHFENLFASNTANAPGLLFNMESAPVRLNDRDGDGIFDTEETAFRTDPGSIDSDGDGYSDYWELDHGYPARDASSPVNVFAFDGVVQNMSDAQRAASPAGDSKAKSEHFDDSEIQGKIEGDRMLLTVRYHNDITQNKMRLHSFAIRTPGQDYWVQWGNHAGTVWHYKDYKDFVSFGGAGLMEATLTGAEFSIPLSHFNGAVSFEVIYYAPGFIDGKEQIVADASATISLSAAG